VRLHDQEPRQARRAQPAAVPARGADLQDRRARGDQRRAVTRVPGAADVAVGTGLRREEWPGARAPRRRPTRWRVPRPARRLRRPVWSSSARRPLLGARYRCRAALGKRSRRSRRDWTRGDLRPWHRTRSRPACRSGGYVGRATGAHPWLERIRMDSPTTGSFVAAVRKVLVAAGALAAGFVVALPVGDAVARGSGSPRAAGPVGAPISWAACHPPGRVFSAPGSGCRSTGIARTGARSGSR
jgi:hypothetical protein